MTSQSVSKRTRSATKWRDWKNLHTDLLIDIAHRLLTFDVAEYLRFRAACRSWRDCTDNPRRGDGMDARFRPRDWIVLYRCGVPSGRTLVNVATGAHANINFPELATHHQLGTADGLLVLVQEGGNNISLLNPLTGALCSFPPLTIDQAVNMPSIYPISYPSSWLSVDPSTIIGTGIDDSTSPSTLMLFLRAGWHPIVFAKTGDENWVYARVVDERCGTKITLVQSPVTFRGRCYFTTMEGAIMTVDLSPAARWPLLKFLLDEDPPVNTETSSFLVRSQGRMLMVRYMFGANLVEGGGYDETEIFLWRGRPSRMEVFEVDIAGKRLVAKSGVGDNHAAFLNAAHTVMVSTKKFPKIAANSVYLNYFLQQHGHFGTYHFRDRTTTPPRIRRSRNGRLYPCACHCGLDDYLVCDVEKAYCKKGWNYWHREPPRRPLKTLAPPHSGRSSIRHGANCKATGGEAKRKAIDSCHAIMSKSRAISKEKHRTAKASTDKDRFYQEKAAQEQNHKTADAPQANKESKVSNTGNTGDEVVPDKRIGLPPNYEQYPHLGSGLGVFVIVDIERRHFEYADD